MIKISCLIVILALVFFQPTFEQRPATTAQTQTQTITTTSTTTAQNPLNIIIDDIFIGEDHNGLIVYQNGPNDAEENLVFSYELGEDANNFEWNSEWTIGEDGQGYFFKNLHGDVIDILPYTDVNNIFNNDHHVVSTVLGTALGGVAGTVVAIGDHADNAFTNLGQDVNQHIHTGVNDVNQFGSNVNQAFHNASQNINNTFNNDVNSVKNSTESAFNGAVADVNNALSNTKTSTDTAIASLNQAVTDINTGALNNVNTDITNAQQAATDAASSAAQANTAALNAVGSSSDSAINSINTSIDDAHNSLNNGVNQANAIAQNTNAAVSAGAQSVSTALENAGKTLINIPSN